VPKPIEVQVKVEEKPKKVKIYAPEVVMKA